jgi:hypothetical protein
MSRITEHPDTHIKLTDFERPKDKLDTIIELLIEIRDRITPKYTITVTDSSTTPIEPKPDDNE